MCDGTGMGQARGRSAIRASGFRAGRVRGVLMRTLLSLVIPAYNEADRLSAGLDRLMDQIASDTTEVLVVDDGSTDETVEVARRSLSGWPQHEVVTLPHNRGKGAAVRAGVARARGDVIAYLDADMATDPQDLSSLVGALHGCDLAIGSRAHEGSVVKRNVHRRAMNRTFGTLGRPDDEASLHGHPVRVQGLQRPGRQALVPWKPGGSLRVRCRGAGYRREAGPSEEEVAVHWTDVAGSHVRPVHDGLQMLGDVARFRFDPQASASRPRGLHARSAQSRTRSIMYNPSFGTSIS